MEVAEEMGLIGFDMLWQGESGGLPVRRRYQREESKKIQLHGIKRWWLVYTQLCSGTQNGNPGLLNPFRPNAPPCL
jgi:hypothetical protein